MKERTAPTIWISSQRSYTWCLVVLLVLRNKFLKNLLSWHQYCGYRRYCNRGLSSVIIRGLQWPRLIISAVHTHPTIWYSSTTGLPEEAEDMPWNWFRQMEQHARLSRVDQLPVLYVIQQLTNLCFPYNMLIGIYFNSLSKQLDMRDSSFGLRRTWNSKKVELAGRGYVGGESEE